MLLNLVSNAVKFTPEGGTVSIGAKRLHEMVEISVTDNGIGIAESDLGRLFTEFQQLDPGAGRKQEGTGLGLALTKRLVALHGGDVRVASDLGKGSTFTLVLPLGLDGQRASKPVGEAALGTDHVHHGVDQRQV
jgi:protein-histidine pros-kinase